MKIAFFSSKAYDKEYFERSNAALDYSIHYLEPHLNAHTARLADGCQVVCAFVNDHLDAETLEALAALGIKHIALRCAGFNNVDLAAAKANKILVSRVPAYSPYAVAEHTIALLLALNRKVHRAHNRVREGNFALDGLVGFDLHGLTVGIIGTGKIGCAVAHIIKGFRCEILACDPVPSAEAVALGAQYVELPQLLEKANVITLHCPLTPESHHLINAEAIARMKDGVTILNTSRGGLIDTRAVIHGLKSGKIGYLGLDVYEEEGELFFEDLSRHVIQDDVFARLTTFPNVLITGHQAFLTHEALSQIAETTLSNIKAFAENHSCPNQVIP